MSNDALTHPNDAPAVTHAFGEAAAVAGAAPSIHNTQPWRWRLIDHVLDLYTDRSRVLHVTDPDARLATLSCGAALHHARMSLAAQGWRVTVHRMPDPAEPDHLARLCIEGRAPVDAPAYLHLRTIPLRRTDRRPVTGAQVGAEQLDAITAAVETEETSLHLLRSDQVLELASAAEHAQRTQAAEVAWQAELAYWTGDTRPAGTGLPGAAVPDGPAPAPVPGPDPGHRGDPQLSAWHDNAAVFVVLHARGDAPADWLRAGEALSAGWLRATERGVAVLPLSAPIEMIATRQAMRVMIASAGHPFLVLRLSTMASAGGVPPHTYRLPADQIIERS